VLAGPEHGRTIPLADIGGAAPWICAHELADLNEREAGAPWETAARTPSDPEVLRRLLQWRSERIYAPVSRPVQRTGVISSRAMLGGLHQHYARV
jgi:hypothetical protein